MRRLSKKHMSKAEAIAEFKRAVIPELVKFDLKCGGNGKPRKTTIGSAWVDFIYSLERTGFISEKQADSWDNPFNR